MIVGNRSTHMYTGIVRISLFLASRERQRIMGRGWQSKTNDPQSPLSRHPPSRAGARARADLIISSALATDRRVEKSESEYITCSLLSWPRRMYLSPNPAYDTAVHHVLLPATIWRLWGMRMLAKVK